MLSEVRSGGGSFRALTSGNILCYSGPQEKREQGVGFLLDRKIAGNVEEFFSISEKGTAVVIKLNNRKRLKIVRAYSRKTSYEDEAAESFYEDVESAMKKTTTQLTILMEEI